jgi:hypothetical protein
MAEKPAAGFPYQGNDHHAAAAPSPIHDGASACCQLHRHDQQQYLEAKAR